MSRDPIQVDVRFAPDTGSKRPYETLARYSSGTTRQLGSYATHEAAEKAAAKVRALFKITGPTPTER